jgi:hypothetical protein
MSVSDAKFLAAATARGRLDFRAAVSRRPDADITWSVVDARTRFARPGYVKLSDRRKLVRNLTDDGYSARIGHWEMTNRSSIGT